MIISDRYGFAFVHIPKCAGSTVREQIRASHSYALIHAPFCSSASEYRLPGAGGPRAAFGLAGEAVNSRPHALRGIALHAADRRAAA